MNFPDTKLTRAGGRWRLKSELCEMTGHIGWLIGETEQQERDAESWKPSENKEKSKSQLWGKK